MLLTNKRVMMRKSEWSDTCMCTLKGKPYGIWINFKEAKEKGREETLKEIDELLMNYD